MDRDLNKFDFLNDFIAECREHLANLNQLLLELEKDPSQGKYYEGITRELHSLKAASRMMGFTHIELPSHLMEDIFMEVQEEQLVFDAQLNDVLLRTLDQVETMVQSLPDLPKNLDLKQLEKNLLAAKQGQFEEIEWTEDVPPPPPAQPPISEAPEGQVQTTPSSPSVPELSAPSEPASPPEEEIAQPEIGSESIRVRTQKLDELFNLIGELVTCRIRLNESLLRFDRYRSSLQNMSLELDQLKRTWSRQRVSIGKTTIHAPQARIQKLEETLQSLIEWNEDTNKHLQEDSFLLSNVANGLRDGIMKTRMLPLQHLFNLMPRVVRDVARSEDKEVELQLEGDDIEVDKKILEQVKEPLIHILRNAVHHGLETADERVSKGKSASGVLHLRARRQSDQIIIEVEDDGRGIDLEKVVQCALKRGMILPNEREHLTDPEILSFLFQPGFTTRDTADDIAGRGVGLDAVQASVQAIKGNVTVTSEAGQGTVFTLRLPLTLATAHVLLLTLAEETYAIPIHSVQEIALLRPEMIEKVEDKDSIHIRNRTVPLVDLSQVLSRPHQDSHKEMAVVVSNANEQYMAFAVDKILGEEEIVVKSLGKQVRRVKHLQGASIMGRGEVLLILNVGDLLDTGKTLKSSTTFSHVHTSSSGDEFEENPLEVLVVDDSITTRRLEQAILETAGYRVDTAINGENALGKLRHKDYDIVISDVQMPVMDGLELTRQIRQISELRDLPVIIVSSMDDKEDIDRGMEAGAQGYITKGQFNQETLIRLINRLVQRKV